MLVCNRVTIVAISNEASSIQLPIVIRLVANSWSEMPPEKHFTQTENCFSDNKFVYFAAKNCFSFNSWRISSAYVCMPSTNLSRRSSTM